MGNSIIEGLAAFAELGVVVAILYESEFQRLERFLLEADKLIAARNKIFLAFCGKDFSSDALRRGEEFRVKLESNSFESDEEKKKESAKIKELCDQQIRLFSRIGASRPRLYWSRKIPLEWHVVVLMWVILGPYIENKRNSFAGYTYARTFMEYANASAKLMLKTNQETWRISDPDPSRQNHCEVKRDHIKQIRIDITRSLAKPRKRFRFGLRQKEKSPS